MPKENFYGVLKNHRGQRVMVILASGKELSAKLDLVEDDHVVFNVESQSRGPIYIKREAICMIQGL